MVTPPIYVGDDQAMLNWKSAPFQAPRYMDGYTVLISTEDYYPDSFTDTIFNHKQMIDPLPEPGNDFNVDAFFYFPDNYTDYLGTVQESYIHDNGLSGSYTTIEDTAATFYTSILEPHSYSLAKYEGQTIYVAFLHDSDDDNLISIDDILVTGTFLSSADETELDVRYSLYPNPATHIVNLSYRFEEKMESVSINVYDVTGKIVLSQTNLDNNVGEHQQKLDVRDFVTGQYTIVLTAGNRQVAKSFMKK